ncbi:MAG TPA: ParB N-terminal domain-containing protein, partial [Anaerolineae bacterium]|nr:ParB N-terminal domain-containing protein [Anaerolineae bacterium]
WVRRAEADLAEVALRHNVAELKRLANSIEQHGLINPISVRLPRPDETVPPGMAYIIVTGERRYWAYVYLLSQGKQINAGQAVTSPQEISITLAPTDITIRAHQLIENLLREDINAVERAQGLSALRYELSAVNYRSPSSGQIEAGEEAVNYSSPQLVPWAEVEAVLGISKRYRIYIMAVLNLSEAAQALVAAHNLAEMTIRPITQKLKDRPDLQVRALQQLVGWQTGEAEERDTGQSIVASVKELVEQLLTEEETEAAAPPETIAPKRSRSVSSAPVIRFRDKVREALDFLNRLKKSDRAELTKALNYDDYADVMLDLRHLRQEIDAILGSVSQTVEPTMTPPTLSLTDSAEVTSTEADSSPQT